MRTEEKIPELSIIVPIYKVEKFLRECVDSILNQTFTDFELILVDDGSPDKCPQMCDMYAEQDSRIRVIHQENKGLSAARNAGIEVAHGRWLGFIDSDDFVAPDFYEKLYTAAVTADADCALCSIQLTDEDGHNLETPDDFRVSENVCKGTDVLETITNRVNTPYLVAWNKIYKREIFQKIRYPVGRLNEDNFIFAELFHTIRKTACVAAPLYYYRQREGSIMRSRYTVRNLDAMWGFVACYEHFQAYGMTELLAPTEKRVFAKLTNVYYGLPYADRKSRDVKKAKQKQLEITKELLDAHMLSVRIICRTIVFQFFPNLYGGWMKMSIVKSKIIQGGG